MGKWWKALRQKPSRFADARHDQQSPTVDWARMVELITAANEQAERESKQQLRGNSPVTDPAVTCTLTHSGRGAILDRVMKRCLFLHKWVIQTETARNIDGFKVISVIPYRICERCGAMRRGIHDRFWRDIVWEPMRAGTDITSGRVRFFRDPSSSLAQLTHSLGISRTRTTDRR